MSGWGCSMRSNYVEWLGLLDGVCKRCGEKITWGALESGKFVPEMNNDELLTLKQVFKGFG